MLTARREEPDRSTAVARRRRLPGQTVQPAGTGASRSQHSTARTHDPAAARNVLSAGPLEIDKDAHTVAVDGAAIDLTATEYKLLLTLADRRGRVQSRAQLLETVWESAPDIQTRTVDMHVQRLRSKLGAAGDLIETVRGFGYRMQRGRRCRSLTNPMKLAQRLLLGALLIVGVFSSLPCCSAGNGCARNSSSSRLHSSLVKRGSSRSSGGRSRTRTSSRTPPAPRWVIASR